MTRLEDRQILVRDIEQAREDGARLVPACALAGIAFERDHPAIQTGNVVLQAVQSPSDELQGCGLTHSLSASAPGTPDAAQSAPAAIRALG